MPVDFKPQLQPYDGHGSVRSFLAHFSIVLAFLALRDERYNEIPRAMLLLAAHLSGPAATWLMTVRLANGGNFPWPTLDAFKSALIARFAPVQGNLMARRKLHELKQTGPVSRYNSRFTELLTDITDITPDVEGLWRYIEGLKPNIAAQVLIREPTTLMRAMELAQGFDEMTFYRHLPTPVNVGVPMELGAAVARTCHICKGMDHFWRKCPHKAQHPCPKCKKVGHPALFCRSAAARQGRSA